MRKLLLSRIQVLNGILITNELVWMKLKEEKKVIMFIAIFETTYGSMKWFYMREVMRKINFTKVCSKHIFECVDIVKASMLVNVNPTNKFSLEHSFRQKDFS